MTHPRKTSPTTRTRVTARTRIRTTTSLNNNNQGQQWGKPPFQQFIPPYSGPASEVNVCRRYNDKICERNQTNCVIMTNLGPLRLYHVCNFMTKKNGTTEMRKGYHPRLDHKLL
jgi:hypothetical protein